MTYLFVGTFVACEVGPASQTMWLLRVTVPLQAGLSLPG